MVNPYTRGEKKAKLKEQKLGGAGAGRKKKSHLLSIPNGPQEVSIAIPGALHRALELCRVHHGNSSTGL